MKGENLNRKNNIMIKSMFFVASLVLLTGCGFFNLEQEEFYQLYYDKEVSECFENFDGMGREVFPDFMS